ncbi:MAG: cytosine permease [Actinomycetota bacterium]|nr:cytosine permease [Actinomycetota bacterium]
MARLGGRLALLPRDGFAGRGITLVAGVVASTVLIVFVSAHSFAQAFDHWMLSTLVWISPWAAILLVDLFVIRRGRLQVADLYRDCADSPYGAVNKVGMISLGFGIIAGWAWQYGMVHVMQGVLAAEDPDVEDSLVPVGMVSTEPFLE